MLGIIIISLIFIGITSTTGFAIISMMSTANQFKNSQSDVEQLDRWRSVIANNLRPFGENQKLVAPFSLSPDLDNSDIPISTPYSTVPKLPGHVGLGVKNSYNRDLIYCPLSLDKDVSTDSEERNNVYIGKENASLDTYDVGINIFGSVKYVTETSGFNFINAVDGDDIVAIIISPFRNFEVSCEDVDADFKVKNDESLQVGLVRVVTRKENMSESINKPVYIDSSDEEYYGDDPSLNELASSHYVLQPAKYIIDLNQRGQSYSLNNDLTFYNKSQGDSKLILLEGLGANTPITASSSRTIEFRGVDVYLDNIYSSGNVTLKFIDSKVTLANSDISNVILENSTLNQIKLDSANNNVIRNTLYSFSSKISLNLTYGAITFIGSNSATSSLINLSNSRFSAVGSGSSSDYELLFNSQTDGQSISLINNDSSMNFLGVNDVRIYRGATGVISDNEISFDIDSSSNLLVKNSNFYIDLLTSTTFAVLGSAKFTDGTVIDYGKNYMTSIWARKNSELEIDDSTIGDNSRNVSGFTVSTEEYLLNSSGNVIIDSNGDFVTVGAKSLSGTNSNIYGQANICWNITESLLQKSGSSTSNPKPDVADMNTYKTLSIVNQSYWTCN